jgi:hypothetical protein
MRYGTESIPIFTDKNNFYISKMFLTIFGALIAARFTEWVITAAVRTWYLPIKLFFEHLKNFNK